MTKRKQRDLFLLLWWLFTPLQRRRHGLHEGVGSIVSRGQGRASDQLGHSVVVLGIFGRSTTARASSSVATSTADGASARR